MVVFGGEVVSCERGIPVLELEATPVTLSLTKRFYSRFAEVKSPPKSVNLFFSIIDIKNTLTDLWRG